MTDVYRCAKSHITCTVQEISVTINMARHWLQTNLCPQEKATTNKNMPWSNLASSTVQHTVHVKFKVDGPSKQQACFILFLGSKLLSLSDPSLLRLRLAKHPPGA